MEEAELRTRYTKAIKTLRAERAMRERVFAADPVKRAAKVAEMDACIETVVWMKDALKAAGVVTPESIQQPLIVDDRVAYP